MMIDHEKKMEGWREFAKIFGENLIKPWFLVQIG